MYLGLSPFVAHSDASVRLLNSVDSPQSGFCVVIIIINVIINIIIIIPSTLIPSTLWLFPSYTDIQLPSAKMWDFFLLTVLV